MATETRRETRYPYGKAPLVLLLLMLATGATLLGLEQRRATQRADLIFALFAKNHYEAYREVLPEFERLHNCRVQMQLVPARGLQSRLQSALLVGAEVPDVVEILNGSMGYFAKGPLEDVGFVDLTDRLHAEGIYHRMVESRFSLWSSRGRIFAMPHDVHPVGLAYRRDLTDALGLDPESLDTWDKFTAAGRRVTADLDGDGSLDRYMMDLPSDGSSALQLLLCQRGGGLFDEHSQVTFDSDLCADLILWYIQQSRGPNRISFPAGGGQSLSQAMLDGLALFYICPDWRTMTFQVDVPALSGKMALMPLPAWEPGGRRTSTWGGTGLCITKACQRQDLAWEFAKFLYLKPDDLAQRFAATNIVPPVRDAWDLPIFLEPSPYYSGQQLGKLYADLARDVPPDWVTPYTELARQKLTESFLNAAARFEQKGEDGLLEYTRQELRRNADYVRRVMARNAFLQASAGEVAR